MLMFDPIFSWKNSWNPRKSDQFIYRLQETSSGHADENENPSMFPHELQILMSFSKHASFQTG